MKIISSNNRKHLPLSTSSFQKQAQLLGGQIKDKATLKMLKKNMHCTYLVAKSKDIYNCNYDIQG